MKSYAEFKYWFLPMSKDRFRIIDKERDISIGRMEKSEILADSMFKQDFYNYLHERPEGSIFNETDNYDYFSCLLGALLIRSYEGYYYSKKKQINWDDETNIINLFGNFKLFLQTTDIQHAPFSKTHYSHRTGLLYYLISCMQCSIELLSSPLFINSSMGSLLVCALLHRLDKIDRYDYTFNSDGTINSLKLKDNILCKYGRGVSALMLISRFISLNESEELAIRWCSGAWYTDSSDYGDLSQANKHNLVLALQTVVSIVMSKG